MKGKFKNFDEIIKYIDGKKCVCCGTELKIELGNFLIGMYPHEDGWLIESLNKKLWIYAHCLNCSYDNSLWKLR